METEFAIGDCVVCGNDSINSNYWVAMENQWNATLQRIWKFRPFIDKPLCSPQCAVEYDGESYYTLKEK